MIIRILVDNRPATVQGVAGNCLIQIVTFLIKLQLDDPVFEELWKEIDANESGYVSFEEFLDFMTKQMVDQDTVSQVMDSFKILAGDKVGIS